METVTDFIFLGSKITEDGDCIHEIKRCLLLGRKVMTNLDNILKSRDITLLTKVHIVKTIVFPVVMYGHESWTIKKAECQRIDAFELECWRRLLTVPWIARRSNQPILKEINPEYSLEGLMLKLKLQYFGHLMWRASPLEKTLMLGKIEVRRRREWQRTRWLNGITDSIDMNLSKLREMVKDREVWDAADHEVAQSWTRLSNSTIATNKWYCRSSRWHFVLLILKIQEKRKRAKHSPSINSMVVCKTAVLRSQDFLFLPFLFYWSIIDLQYYISFGHTTQWFNIFYTLQNDHYKSSYPITIQSFHIIIGYIRYTVYYIPM